MYENVHKPARCTLHLKQRSRRRKLLQPHCYDTQYTKQWQHTSKAALKGNETCTYCYRMKLKASSKNKCRYQQTTHWNTAL